MVSLILPYRGSIRRGKDGKGVVLCEKYIEIPGFFTENIAICREECYNINTFQRR
jgi:hypothetical protein